MSDFAPSCVGCGGEVPSGAAHCPHCGRSQRETPVGGPMPVTFGGRPSPEVANASTRPGAPIPTSPPSEVERERFPPGAILVQQYRVVSRLGEGGMGAVYLARDDVSGQEVAVKVLPAALAREGDIRERFVQEARALAALDHPAIVPLVTFARDGDDHFLVMKYVPGRSIEDLVEEKGALEIETARSVFVTVVEALGYAHARGVVHRDVKPANVLLSDEGRIFLVDFGIAKRGGSTRLTQTGMLMGTPQYMSPEQISGHPVDGRSDLYAAGLLLFEMLAGRPPFTGDKTFTVLRQHVEAPVPDPRAIRGGDIPRELLVVVEALLRKDPEARPPDADATLRLLAEAQSATPAFGTSSSEPVPKASQPTPTTTALSSALAGDDEEDELVLELHARRRVRMVAASLVLGALAFVGALFGVPRWMASAQAPAPPPPASTAPRVDPHDEAVTLLLRQANESLLKSEPATALAVLDAALDMRPDDKIAQLLRARALVESKKRGAAKQALDALAARTDLTKEDEELIANYRAHLDDAGKRAPRGGKSRRVKRGESAPVAPDAPDAPIADAELRKSAAATRREARACYEQHVLAKAPDARGVVVVEVQIQPDGSVGAAQIAENGFLDGAELGACLAGLAKTWTFPKFEGAPISFRYAIDLRPTL